MANTIIMYSATMCHDCQQLKKFMAEHDIGYENRDIREHPEYARELEEKTGKQGVPFLVIDGEWVRGYQVGQPFSEAYARQILGMSEPEQ